LTAAGSDFFASGVFLGFDDDGLGLVDAPPDPGLARAGPAIATPVPNSITTATPKAAASELGARRRLRTRLAEENEPMFTTRTPVRGLLV
jgi:hypothetical protein